MTNDRHEDLLEENLARLIGQWADRGEVVAKDRAREEFLARAGTLGSEASRELPVGRILAVAASLLVVAVTVWLGVTGSSSPSPSGNTLEQVRDVSFRAILATQKSLYWPLYDRVTRQVDWDMLWKEVGDGKAPPVDFSQEMVLIAAGPLQRIRETTDRLEVRFTRTASGPIGLAVVRRIDRRIEFLETADSVEVRRALLDPGPASLRLELDGPDDNLGLPSDLREPILSDLRLDKVSPTVVERVAKLLTLTRVMLDHQTTYSPSGVSVMKPGVMFQGMSRASVRDDNVEYVFEHKAVDVNPEAIERGFRFKFHCQISVSTAGRTWRYRIPIEATRQSAATSETLPRYTLRARIEAPQRIRD